MPYVVGPTPDSGTMGAKLSWTGDTFIMRINHTFTGTVTNSQGQPADFTGTFKGTLKLKKK